MREKGNSVALIPARSGSERIKDKNVTKLGEHPLLAYSIAAALASKEFDKVVCVTDSDKYADIALYYGAEVPKLRPKSTARADSPDIDWVKWILNLLSAQSNKFYAFSILRPTNPFRTAKTVNRAFQKFYSNDTFDSIRAVELCKQHPGKMWMTDGEYLDPLLPNELAGVPWHSSQYAALPKVYIQNASLEISLVENALLKNSISGSVIGAFFTDRYEGFDINIEEDLVYAERLLETGKANTQTIYKKPYGVR